MKKIIVRLTIFIGIIGSMYFVFDTPDYHESDALTQDNDLRSDASLELENLREIFAIENLSERKYQLKIFFAKLISDNPFETVALIEQLRDQNHRQLSYQIALITWSELHQDEFDRWLSAQTPNIDLDLALSTLTEKNQSDYPAMIRYAEKIADTSMRESIISAVLEYWVLEEPNATIQWLLSGEGNTENWLEFVFQTLTTQLPSTAISLLSNFEGDNLDLAIETIVNNISGNQMNYDILAAIRGLRSYEIHQNLIMALIPVLFEGQETSLSYLSELVETLLPGETQDELQQQLAGNWASIHPSEAAEYAESLNGEAQLLAIDGVVASWLEQDLVDASNWLETLDGNLDIPANTLARGSASKGHIQVADKWLNEIENEAMRNNAIYDVVNEWYKNDPRTGLYYLVFQKSLSNEAKLNYLHQKYPDRVFLSPESAYNEISREGNLLYESAYN